MPISEQQKIAGMIHYFHGKLAIINYNMAVHEGNANRRLASQSVKILLLPPSAVPEKYQKEFNALVDVIKKTHESLNSPGLTPVKLNNIRNSTAVKYIKLLWLIEDELNSMES